MTDRLAALIVPDLTAARAEQVWRELPHLPRLTCAQGEVELLRDGGREHARIFRADLVALDTALLDRFELVLATRPSPSGRLDISQLR